MNHLVLTFHVLIGAACLSLELWFIRVRTAKTGDCQQCHSRRFWNYCLYKSIEFCRMKVVKIPVIGLRLAEMDKVVMLIAALYFLRTAMKEGEKQNAGR